MNLSSCPSFAIRYTIVNREDNPDCGFCSEFLVMRVEEAVKAEPAGGSQEGGQGHGTGTASSGPGAGEGPEGRAGLRQRLRQKR